MGQLTSGEACVRARGEISKIQSHVRVGLDGEVGGHAEVFSGGGFGEEKGVFLCWALRFRGGDRG